MDIDFDNIAIEVDGDLIFITVAKYKLFMSYGSIGMDSFLLYCHLMFTARCQKTNQVWANDNYIRTGLHWGSERLRKAKNLLYDLGIIEKVQKRDKNGHFEGNYIKVKTKTTPFEIECIENAATLDTGTPQTRPPVSRNKCFNEKEKCFNEKENALTSQKKKNALTKPTLEIINNYISENGYNVNGEAFYNYYNGLNWKDKNEKKVKNWKNKLYQWHLKNTESSTENKDYSWMDKYLNKDEEIDEHKRKALEKVTDEKKKFDKFHKERMMKLKKAK